MPTVAVNPPRTPVTKGSSGIAAATVPNICKMPGPPAPFVPTPLPNIGKSGDSPKGYSKKVKVEGQPVAIKGASFKSVGDIASKGTGGGIVSANTHGPTKFVGPGSIDVKIEGKNIQYLGDPMVNNCGSPPNSAATGEAQGATVTVSWEAELQVIVCKCSTDVKPNKQSTCRQLGTARHDCCNRAIQKRKNKTGPGRQEQLAPERGYTNPASPSVSRIRMTRVESFLSGQIRGSIWPDALLLNEQGNPKQLFEFKFKCPAGTRTRRKRKGGPWLHASGNQPTPQASQRQLRRMEALGARLGIDNQSCPPTVVTNEACP